MGSIRYAIYEPAEVGLPWLAVALDDTRIVDSFACPSKKAAEQVLRSMKVRWTVKNRRAHT